ncbi:MAG: hypothetical protein KDD02_07110 [Phaeodactylibacter sp.]|nr:hypothetical protein [Phaeodactylibacter sp.]MCB9303062.1 hypothetical protein [Lewinellaceae bacterium]
MSDIQHLHKEAMAIVHEAFTAQKAGDSERYLELTHAAYEQEKAAAWLLFQKLDAEPTRSVLFRSAAQLAFNCGKIREAEQLIAAALAGNPPLEILAELRQLNRKVLDAFEAAV